MRHLMQFLPTATLTLVTGFFCVSAGNAQEHLIGQQPAANRVIKLRSSLVPASPSPTTLADSDSSRTMQALENANASAQMEYAGEYADEYAGDWGSTNAPHVAEQPTAPPKPIEQSLLEQQKIGSSYSGIQGDVSAFAEPRPMSVTKTGPAIDTLIEAPGYINLNQTAALRIKLRNVGDTSANSVKLIATLPAHAKFSRATPPATRVDGQNYEFQLSNLGAQQTREIVLELIPTEKIGLDIGTEVVVENTQRIAVGVRQPKIKLSLQGPMEANMGQMLTHLVLLENIGDGLAQDIQLVANFPQQLRCKKKDHVTIPKLQPGQSVAIELPALCQSAGLAELNVSVAAVGVDSLSAKSNVTIRQPELEVSAVGPQMNFVNREGIYTIQIDNTGEVDASDVKIHLNMPNGLKITTISREATVDAETGVLMWVFDRIPAKTEQSIMLKTMATTEGEQICNIKVQSNETKDKDIQLTTRVDTRADLSFSVKNQSGPIQVGGNAQFLIVVENKGSSSAENISINIQLPDSFTTNQQDSIEMPGFGNAVNFQDARIEPGQKREFVFSATSETQGEHVFRGELTAQGTERKITVEDAVYVYEVSEMRVSELLSPAIPR